MKTDDTSLFSFRRTHSRNDQMAETPAIHRQSSSCRILGWAVVGGKVAQSYRKKTENKNNVDLARC